MKLIAKTYILFESRNYKPGEELPAHNPGMVEAWLEAGTAVWMEEVTLPTRAKPVTAEPGLAGKALVSESENGEDLVGKVPKTAKRARK